MQIFGAVIMLDVHTLHMKAECAGYAALIYINTCVQNVQGICILITVPHACLLWLYLRQLNNDMANK